ncbi:MAG: hypothetical protein IKA21_03240 [Phascolarctobacterium sp.]|nr:hypothetical protein [Phascolarctobacterium sp.]
MENKELVNARAKRLKDFFAENKIECFEIVETKDENNATIFRSKMQIKGQILPFAVLIDNSVYSMLQVQIVSGLVKGEAFTKIAPYLNEFNNNYRVFKFVVTPEGDLLLNACLVTEDSTFNPALVNAIIGECAKFLEAEYAGIMEHLWKESK